MTLSLVSAALLAALPLRVSGSSDCPRPAEVAARLEGLLPGPPPAESELHLAVVERRGAALHLELRDAKGAILAQRDVVDRSACPDLAGVAAVMIAAWEAELRGTSPDLPPAPVLPKVSRPWSWDVGGAGFAAFSGAWAWAPGGLAIASVGTPGGFFAVELVAGGSGARPVFVGRGRAQWFHAGAGLGARVRLARESLGVDLHAQAFYALLSVQGAGFMENFGSLDFDPGALVGARLWYRLGSFRPWVGVGGFAWFRPQQVRVQQSPGGVEESAPLPRFELLLSAGVLFGVD